MDKETVFTEGLSYFLPFNDAPEWKKGQLWIEPKRFVEWMKSNQSEMVDGKDREGNECKLFKIDLQVSKGGKGYAAVAWKPSKAETGDGLSAADVGF